MTDKFIKSVVYTVSKAYEDYILVITEPPFLFSRTVYTPMAYIKMQIEFTEETGIIPMSINYHLNLKDNRFYSYSFLQPVKQVYESKDLSFD